jgi:NAD(P)-dependent dehydrogenase (short-subunit alcohol dehydrogenase family)
MSNSFSLVPKPISAPKRRRVLITGAGGQIGTVLARDLVAHHDLRLHVQQLNERVTRALDGLGEIVAGDIRDLDAMQRAATGIDTVVHLAANSSAAAGWDDLLDNNIIGTYNIFAAAHEARCRRVLFASSIHAVSGYVSDRQVHADDPVNPGDLYGVSKCFGEALARYMATQRGLSSIVIRIGAFQKSEVAEDEAALPLLDAFISHRDLCALVRCAIDDESLSFAIVHGLSANRFNRMEIATTRQLLGYAPQDSFTDLNEATRDLKLTERLISHSERQR